MNAVSKLLQDAVAEAIAVQTRLDLELAEMMAEPIAKLPIEPLIAPLVELSSLLSAAGILETVITPKEILP